jgi:hypothetical protein
MSALHSLEGNALGGTQNISCQAMKWGTINLLSLTVFSPGSQEPTLRWDRGMCPSSSASAGGYDCSRAYLITLKRSSRVEEYAEVKIPIKGVKYIHDIRRERVLLTVVPRPLSTDCIGLVHVPMQLSGRRQHASGP